MSTIFLTEFQLFSQGTAVRSESADCLHAVNRHQDQGAVLSALREVAGLLSVRIPPGDLQIGHAVRNIRHQSMPEIISSAAAI